MPDCIFCKIVNGELPSQKVYEDDDVLAFLDINPTVHGHTLIIPKEHHENILETPPELIAKIFQVIQKIAPAVLAAVEANAFNLGNNCGSVAGQVIFHTHFHLLPRKPDDGKRLWGSRPAREGELEELEEKIKRNLL